MTGATLLQNGVAQKDADEEQQKDQIAPPDERVAQQINAIAAAREELALKRANARD